MTLASLAVVLLNRRQALIIVVICASWQRMINIEEDTNALCRRILHVCTEQPCEIVLSAIAYSLIEVCQYAEITKDDAMKTFSKQWDTVYGSEAC
jgi:hypothetical protein